MAQKMKRKKLARVINDQSMPEYEKEKSKTKKARQRGKRREQSNEKSPSATELLRNSL